LVKRDKNGEGVTTKSGGGRKIRLTSRSAQKKRQVKYKGAAKEDT